MPTIGVTPIVQLPTIAHLENEIDSLIPTAFTLFDRVVIKVQFFRINVQ
jgi:hypothetical protein